MCAITSGLDQAEDQSYGSVYVRQALCKVRRIIGFDRLCRFETNLNTRPDVLQHTLAARSLWGSELAQSVMAETLARGPSHSQVVSVEQRKGVLASSIAPWHKAEYPFLDSGSWHQPDLCSSHNSALC